MSNTMNALNYTYFLEKLYYFLNNNTPITKLLSLVSCAQGKVKPYIPSAH